MRPPAKALKDIKDQQRSLTQRRTMALATIRREPELIAPAISPSWPMP